MSRDGIPMEEWLAELQRLSNKNDEGRTVDEWGEAMGVCSQTARHRLIKAHRLGWVRRGTARREGLSGIPRPVKVYQVVKPKRGGR